MAPCSENIFLQILWTCILCQSVSLFPVINKGELSENNAKLKDPLTSMKYLHGRAISNKASSLAMAKLGSKESRTFLQQEFTDILKSRQQSSNETEGYASVHEGKNLKSAVESSKVFSQRRARVVNLRFSPKLNEQRRTGKGQTRILIRPVSAVSQTLDRNLPLHPVHLDSHQSFNNPAVNHRPTSPPQSLGELRQPERKSNAVFTYESKAGGRSDGIQKAEALTANLQATPQRRVSTMILIISSTFVVLLVTCVTVSIFQCCCRKKSSNEDLSPVEDKNDQDNTIQIRRSRSSIHDTPTYRPLSINSTGDGLEEVLPPQLSVRDKIKAFETAPDEQKTSSPDPGKPVRKRPKSKAFEEFENQGIIIGMGKVRSNRPKSSTDPDGDNEPGLLNEIMASMSPEYNNITMLSEHSDKPIQNGSHTTPDTEISPGYIDEDDEFGEIQRSSHILRSFKRAPPPKNRSRSKRSSRRRLPLKDSTNISDNTEIHSEIPDSFLSYEEEKPTNTSVQKGLYELGSPSIHSSESRTDMDRLTGASANGDTPPVNSHTSHAINGYSHPKEEWSRKRSDKEATPPEKSLPNGKPESRPPKGMTTYENPCYESLDVVQANIHRGTETRKSPDKADSPPSRLPRARDRQKTPPNKETHMTPTGDEDRPRRLQSGSRISPESHTSPEITEGGTPSRISPPKYVRNDTHANSNSERRKSWKEIPPNDSDQKALKQTHL